MTAVVRGSGFRVQGSGFRVQGSGFRVQGVWRVGLSDLFEGPARVEEALASARSRELDRQARKGCDGDHAPRSIRGVSAVTGVPRSRSTGSPHSRSTGVARLNPKPIGCGEAEEGGVVTFSTRPSPSGRGVGLRTRSRAGPAGPAGRDAPLLPATFRPGTRTLRS